jgi:hypothetical protein
MTLLARLPAICDATLFSDIRSDMAVALSDKGFAELHSEINRRHSSAFRAVQSATEALRVAQASFAKLWPVLDVVNAIEAMRVVAASHGKTPADDREEMQAALAPWPIDPDDCAKRLGVMLDGVSG